MRSRDLHQRAAAHAGEAVGGAPWRPPLERHRRPASERACSCANGEIASTASTPDEISPAREVRTEECRGGLGSPVKREGATMTMLFRVMAYILARISSNDKSDHAGSAWRTLMADRRDSTWRVMRSCAARAMYALQSRTRARASAERCHEQNARRAHLVFSPGRHSAECKTVSRRCLVASASASSCTASAHRP